MDSARLPMMAQRNAQAQQDAFADLASWTNSIKKKDESIKTRQQTGKKGYFQIFKLFLNKMGVSKLTVGPLI